jgi:hypothetical protein
MVSFVSRLLDTASKLRMSTTDRARPKPPREENFTLRLARQSKGAAYAQDDRAVNDVTAQQITIRFR